MDLMHTFGRLQHHLREAIIRSVELIERTENHPPKQVVLEHFYGLHARQSSGDRLLK